MIDPTITSTTSNTDVVVTDVDDEIETPDEFVCPISLEIMKDPVMSKDGQNYDRQAILEWLKMGNTSCPLTRQPLKLTSLVTNHNLKVNILKWKTDHGITVDNDDGSNAGQDGDGCDDYATPAFMGMVHLADSDLHATILRNNRFNNNGYRNSRRNRNRNRSGNRSGNGTSRSARNDDLSDLLALYDEVLDLVGHDDNANDDVTTNTTTTTTNDNTTTTTSTEQGNRRRVSFETEKLMDDDEIFAEIKSMYDEVLDSSNHNQKRYRNAAVQVEQ